MATATYVYWQTKLKHDREFFKEKLLCQKIADRYQSEGSGSTIGWVTVKEVEYSPERHSCLAMTDIHNSSTGDDQLFITDLVSGWQEYVGSYNAHKDTTKSLQDVLNKQDEQFTKLLHASSR